MKSSKRTSVTIAVAFVVMSMIWQGHAATIFQDDFETFTGGGDPSDPRRRAADGGVDITQSIVEVGSITAGNGIINTRPLPGEVGTSNRLVHHTALGGSPSAVGLASQTAGIGDPLHWEFVTNLSSQDNTGYTYLSAYNLTGPGGEVLSLQFQTPANVNTVNVLDHTLAEITTLAAPSGGSPTRGADYLVEIDYLVGQSSWTVSFTDATPTTTVFVVNSMITPGGTVDGWSLTQLSSAHFGAVDDMAMWIGEPTPPVMTDMAIGVVEAISFQTEAGTNYVLESSSNRVDWASTGLKIQGDGTTMLITDPAGALSPQKSYRVVEE